MPQKSRHRINQSPKDSNLLKYYRGVGSGKTNQVQVAANYLVDWAAASRVRSVLLRLKYRLRDFAARNFFCNLIAEILIYTIWGSPMVLGFVQFKGVGLLALLLFGLSTTLGLWLMIGLDERRLVDFPEKMLRLEWFRSN